MKARRTMEHRALIQEVVRELSRPWLMATVPDIKKVCDIYTICHSLVLRRI